MQLTHPESLWLLCLLPVLYWLARPTRPQKLVASPYLTLWRRARAKLQRRPPRFHGLRWWLGAIAASALVIAASGPRLFEEGGRARLVLAIDHSPSMLANDVADGRSRLEEAKRRARALLAQVPETTPVRLLGIDGDGPQVLAGDDRPRAAALLAIDRLDAGRGGARLRFLRPDDWREDDYLRVITDGAGMVRPEGFAVGPGAGPRLDLEIVGEESANTGVAGVRVADSWPLPDLELEIGLIQTGDEPAAVRLRAGPVGGGGIAQSIDLAPGLSAHRLRVVRGDGGTFEVVVERAGDVFAADDRVVFDAPPPPRPKVAVVAPPGRPRRALVAIAKTLGSASGGAMLDSARAAEADLLLVEGGRLPKPPAKGRRYMLFGTRGILPGDAPVPEPSVLDWDRQHPVTRGLDLSGLSVKAGLSTTDVGGDRVLINGDRGPLLLARNEPRALLFRFELGRSNLGLLPDFPRLARRGLAWLFGADSAQQPRVRGLLDVQESRIAAATPSPSVPVRWKPHRGDLAVTFVLLALLAWAVRAWIKP